MGLRVLLLLTVAHFDASMSIKQVMNIFNSYGDPNAAEGDLGLHRLVEALKHMFAIRMNLGDPKFVRVNEYISKMLSSSFAEDIREKIFDNTTFPASYYMYKYDLLTLHFESKPQQYFSSDQLS